jgi:hypothetical protein
LGQFLGGRFQKSGHLTPLSLWAKKEKLTLLQLLSTNSGCSHTRGRDACFCPTARSIKSVLKNPSSGNRFQKDMQFGQLKKVGHKCDIYVVLMKTYSVFFVF